MATESTSDSSPRPPLRRPGNDRVLGGVAAAYARYLGIDPVLTRIAFVVLAFVGGSGIVLYLASWVLIPSDDASTAEWPFERTPEPALVIGLLIAVVGAFLVFNSWFDHDLIIGAGLIGAGLYLLAGRRSSSDDPGPPDHSAHGPPPPAPGSEHQPPGPTSDLGPTTDLVPTPLTDHPMPLSDDSGRRSGPTTVADAPAITVASRRPRSPVTPVTLGVLLLYAGIVVFLQAADLMDVTPTTGIAIALGIVAVGLLVGSWWGPSRALIGAGLLVASALALSTLFDFPIYHGTGETRVSISEIEDLDESYTKGAGVIDLDLSDLELDGSDRAVAAGVSFGELIITVPPDMAVEIEARVKVGELDLLGQTDEGITNELSFVQRAADEDGVLSLDVEVGFGRLEVRHG